MFFKPKWYSMLPDYLKPMGDEVINRIKEFQKKSGWTDEIIFAGIMVSQWAVKRIQKACLEQYKKQMPNASDQALWTGVLLSKRRLGTHPRFLTLCLNIVV